MSLEFPAWPGFLDFRRTPEERIAARRHRIWADLAMISRDLAALHHSNTDILSRQEASAIGNAASYALRATVMVEGNG